MSRNKPYQWFEKITELTEDVTINVTPDGGLPVGEMDINLAIEFVNKHAYVSVRGSSTAYDAGKRAPQITLNLLEGEHSIDNDHSRLENVTPRVRINGPNLDADWDEPLAIVNVPKTGGTWNWQFVRCSLISLENLRVRGGVRANSHTRMDFNPQQSGSTGHHVVIEGQAWWDQMCSSYNVFNLTAESIAVSFGSYAALSNMRFNTTGSNDMHGSRPMVHAYSAGSILLEGQCDFSNYGAGSPPDMSGTNPFIRAEGASNIYIQGDVNLPSTRVGGVAVSSKELSSIVIQGDVDWNGRSPGEVPLVDRQADGSYYSVSGTVTL